MTRLYTRTGRDYFTRPIRDGRNYTAFNGGRHESILPMEQPGWLGRLFRRAR